MEIRISGTCEMVLDHNLKTNNVTLVGTNISMGLSENLDKSYYLDKEEYPTEEGVKTLTNAFIQGLVGNIHYAHQKNYRDSAEHLRFIISELERGFVEIVTVNAKDK